MKSITVNESYTEIIPLPAVATTSTISFKVYIGSTGGNLTTGTLTLVVGVQWKASFTPTTLNEIYILEATDAGGDIMFSASYIARGETVTDADSATVLASKTELVNKALTMIGANPIVNLTDDTRNANIMSRIYKIALRGLLSECLWNFARRRSLLALSTTTMAWYHTNEVYVYQRPSDVIRILGTNDADAMWREEGDYIISDTINLGIEYVAYVSDPSKYSSSFVEALIDKLCSDAAYMILNSGEVAEKYMEKYNKVSLPKAMAENAQIGIHQVLKDDAWELAKTQDNISIA
jgi:hypothetical protein